MDKELIADYQCICGEGPLWHPDEQRLYWLDLSTGRMLRYDPATGYHEQCYEGDVVGGFTIQADGALLLLMGDGVAKTWRDGKLTTVMDGIPAERGSTFNDCIADPKGRVYSGTVMNDKNRRGRLYRLDTDKSLAVMTGDVGNANGLGFSPDLKRMYFTDSAAYRIYAFDYDQETGNINNQKTFVHGPEEDGLPDGMTVDAEGYVWSAHWGGSCVIRYTPDGREDARIEFPVKQVSSVTFGGPDYSDMYVTTAGADNRAENGPGAGALFRVRPGIKSVPDFRSRIGL